MYSRTLADMALPQPSYLSPPGVAAGGSAQREFPEMMLEKCNVVAFVATTQPEKARAFYCEVLGLRFEEDSQFALVVRTANAMLRIQKVQAFTPFPFTALGWEVENIRATAKQLLDKGVKCERFGGMTQDDLGIWVSPSGAMVCWFKDPDGNVLSLSQFS
jgi:catechol 2,3-dioxygenase-like lactoylglutathione lyase family enzyme